MDYFNPAAGLPDPSTYANMPGGGFWTGKVAADNQAQLAPFRQNALSQQDLALKTAQAKFSEEQAPNAVAGRQQAIAAKMATDTGTVASQPSLTADQIASHEAHLKLLPAENKAAIEKASQEYNKAKGTPQQAVYDGLSDMAPEIHSAPPGMKPLLWQSKLAELQHLHPDAEIPEDMKQWSPQNEEQIQHNYMGRVHSVADTQKKEEARAAKEATIEAAKIHAGATLGAAGISNTGAMAREKLRLETDTRNQNPGQAQQADMKLLDSPTKLSGYATANGFASAEEAKTAIQGRIAARKQDMNQKTALELAKIRANNSIMPGSPDQGRTAGDLYREELGKLGGTTPAADPRSDAQAAIAKGAPRDAVAARYKQMTGKDL